MNPSESTEAALARASEAHAAATQELAAARKAWLDENYDERQSKVQSLLEQHCPPGWASPSISEPFDVPVDDPAYQDALDAYLRGDQALLSDYSRSILTSRNPAHRTLAETIATAVGLNPTVDTTTTPPRVEPHRVV